MNEAEKFKRKSTKTLDINGIPFTIRKLNPHDSFLMSLNYPLREFQKDKDGEFVLDENKEKKLVPYTMEQLREIGQKEQRMMLLRVVLNPKIVDKPYGEEGEDEVPFELVDARTAEILSEEILSFSYEVWEDSSVNLFREESDREDADEHSTEHEDSTVDASRTLRPRSRAVGED